MTRGITNKRQTAQSYTPWLIVTVSVKKSAKTEKIVYFLASQSCSFLHPQLSKLDTYEIRALKDHIKTENGNLASLEKKIKLLEKHADAGCPKSDINMDLEQGM